MFFQLDRLSQREKWLPCQLAGRGVVITNKTFVPAGKLAGDTPPPANSSSRSLLLANLGSNGTGKLLKKWVLGTSRFGLF